MDSDMFTAVVSAGSLRPENATATFDHNWTPEGVSVDTDFTGAHLLHLAIAGCVLNDTYREASAMGTPVDGVRVVASGDFDRNTWQSTGVTYSVEIDSPASSEAVEELLDVVDRVAEIPKALRSGAPVSRA